MAEVIPVPDQAPSPEYVFFSKWLSATQTLEKKLGQSAHLEEVALTDQFPKELAKLLNRYLNINKDAYLDDLADELYQVQKKYPTKEVLAITGMMINSIAYIKHNKDLDPNELLHPTRAMQIKQLVERLYPENDIDFSKLNNSDALFLAKLSYGMITNKEKTDEYAKTHTEDPSRLAFRKILLKLSEDFISKLQ